MKALVLMASLVLSVGFSTSAHASNACSKSWEEIQRSTLSADFPKIQFGTAWVTVDAVCVKGSKLYTTSKVDVCLQAGTGESSECLRPARKTLSTNIAYKHDIPTREAGFETIKEKHALTYEVPVGRNGSTFMQVCTKTFTIPACN